MQALIALTCAYERKQSSNQSHSHVPNGRRERHVSQESLILLYTSDINVNSRWIKRKKSERCICSFTSNGDDGQECEW